MDVVRGLKPYAALSWNYSSNLLYNPPELNEASDWYLTAEAGINTELTLSRQRFLIDARVVHNAYDRFNQFDYTGGDAKAVWKWVAGRLWDGELGYAYARTLRSFSNQLIPQKDIQDRNKVFGNVNRWLTDHWRVGGQADWTDVSFSESARLDRTSLGAGATLEYVTATKNTIGVEAAYSAAEYSNQLDRDYDDWRLGPTLDWRLTTKTRVKANAGYKTREYDVLTNQDFSGLVGRITAIWKATAKSTVTAAAYRDLSNLDDEISNYAIVDGISIEPRWDITAKTSLRALAAFERRDFEGADDVDLVLGIPERVDEVTALELWLDWNVRRNVSLSIGLGSENRDSDRPLRDYDVQTVQARFSIGL